MIVLLILLIFLIIYTLLFFYYRNGWFSLSAYQSHATSRNIYISVLIPARNEEKNIGSLLQALKDQSYSEEFFEVIVIDDFSSDSTARIVEQQKEINIYLIQPGISALQSSKKKAIEAGIQKAKGELIVTTDADCIPGKNWLGTINDFYWNTDASFIAAPVKFTSDGSFIQSFQLIDFLTLQGITAASVAKDFHSMCNGANLAYKKQSFIDVKGFEGIDQVASGDDMLLMHKIRMSEPDKVFYLKSNEAIIQTKPMPGLRSFLMQRKRWASKTFVYRDYRIIAVLFFVYLFNCFFLYLFVAAFFYPFFWWYFLVALLIKTGAELLLVYPVAVFYHEKKSLRWFFFFQPFHILYTVIIGLISQFGRYEWRGRRTK